MLHALDSTHDLLRNSVHFRDLRQPNRSEAPLTSQRNFWIPVACGAIILTIGVGARNSFGIFQTPIALDLKVGRELWSFGNAAAMLLMGALSPWAGNVADRFGTARTVAAGGAIYVAGMFVMASATGGAMLILGNLLTGVGMAAASFGPIFAAITRLAPPEKRSLAMGITTAGGSFGQFAIVPFASILQARLNDWHATLAILGVVSLLLIPLALGLRDRSAVPGAPAPTRTQSTREALAEAFAHRSFWLLTIGYFVCGFHVAFVGLHLPAYIADKSVSMTFFGTPVSPIEMGGWAIGIVGLANILGAMLWGWLGGIYQKKNMLVLLYFLRAMAFLLFLVLPLSWVSVLVFAASLGFLWLGTVPLTNALVGYIFGPTYMATLSGIVFFSHQLGGFLAGWGAGRLYDIQGNYDAMWVIAIALGLMAAVINWPIRERPVERLQVKVAAA
jgi:MFS family permease